MNDLLILVIETILLLTSLICIYYLYKNNKNLSHRVCDIYERMKNIEPDFIWLQGRKVYKGDIEELTEESPNTTKSRKENEQLDELIVLNEVILYRFKHLNQKLGVSYGPLTE